MFERREIQMAIRSGDEAGVSRRAFLKISAGGALALYVGGRSGGAEVFAAPIPGGTLAPGSIDKFVRPLVIPPAMPRSGTNSYDIAVRQFTQEILPPPLPPDDRVGLRRCSERCQRSTTRRSPSRRLVAHRSRSHGSTSSRTPAATSVAHLLPVDPTLHWANPPGGTDRAEIRDRSSRRHRAVHRVRCRS